MRKKLLIVIVVMVFLFGMALSFAGCSKVVEGVRQVLSGNVSGEIGKSYSTQWFDFTVKSVKEVDSYAGYEPEAGYRFIAVDILETGAFDEPITMGTFDFYMDADTFFEYIWPLDPFDDSMMPSEFMLEKGETVEYIMVYVIPEEAPNLKLMYTEIDIEDNEGVTFTINLNL